MPLPVASFRTKRRMYYKKKVLDIFCLIVLSPVTLFSREEEVQCQTESILAVYLLYFFSIFILFIVYLLVQRYPFHSPRDYNLFFRLSPTTPKQAAAKKILKNQ